jgi:hypothetical protein
MSIYERIVSDPVALAIALLVFVVLVATLTFVSLRAILKRFGY